MRARHRAVDGRPLIEDATPRVHLLELGSGPTAETSPAIAVEVHVAADRVWVVHWVLGERFRTVGTAGGMA